MAEYIGRFAPSPSGPLHEGSLFTALASFLDAKAHQGKWLLRIEDIDPPREEKGASQAIIDCLEAHGLFWDEQTIYQSQRLQNYQHVLDGLLANQHAFYCTCSRSELAAFNGYYPGTCRACNKKPATPAAIRLKTGMLDNHFIDRLQGLQKPEPIPAQCFDDFVLYRKDGLFAYQLACVVDDIHDGINYIVRGDDILPSTFKQAWLYHYLAKPQPRYLHLPVITNAQGQKLSKQNKAKALDLKQNKHNLLNALSQLKQPLPPAHLRQHTHDILRWAIDHWQMAL